MLISLDDLIFEAQANGSELLLHFLEEISGKIETDRIDGLTIIKEGEQPPLQANHLYFTKGSCSGYQVTGNIIHFESEAEMYALAYTLSTAISQKEIARDEKIIKTSLSFNNITLKDPDFMKMIILFNELIKNPVVIYDEFWNIIVLTADYLTDYDRHGPITKLHTNSLHYYKQSVTLTKENAPVKECNRLLFPCLYLNKTARGHLALFDVDTPYDKIDPTLLEIFANCVLVEMKRILDVQAMERKFINDFLYDIIYRKKERTSEIERKAKMFNIPMDGTYCIVAFRPLEEADIPKPDSNAFPYRREFIYERVTTHISNCHKKMYKQDIVTNFENVTYILHKISPKNIHNQVEINARIKNFCQDIKNVLRDSFDGLLFQIGVGDIVTGLQNISISFYQAKTAISYGELLYGDKREFTMLYSENGFLKLFGRLKETDSLEEIIPQSLYKLREHDEKTNSQLYQTLKVYLDCNCNAKKTSERLYLHYKTTLYRLNKIKTDFNIDIESVTSRLYIELGMQLLDLSLLI